MYIIIHLNHLICTDSIIPINTFNLYFQSASFVYIISYILEYTVNYGYPKAKTDAHSHDSPEKTTVFLDGKSSYNMITGCVLYKSIPT